MRFDVRLAAGAMPSSPGESNASMAHEEIGQACTNQVHLSFFGLGVTEIGKIVGSLMSVSCCVAGWQVLRASLEATVRACGI